MKAIFKCATNAAGLSCGKKLCAGAVLLMAVSAPAQNLFVSDSADFTVYDYTVPGAAQSTFASGLLSPEGLAFDGSGNLFVATLLDGNITKIAPGGAQTPFASGLISPFGLAFDSTGNLFAADAFYGIIKYTPSGTPSPYTPLPIGYSPYGLAFDKSGDLFVTARNGVTGTVFEISPDGSSISQFATGLVSPYDLKFDSAGDLFVADNGDGTIDEYDPTGLLINTFSTGTGAWGLAFDNSDNLYVSDAGLNIYEYSPADYNTPGGGTPSIFTSDSGLFNGTYLAFPSSAEAAPEQASTLGLLAIGVMAILGGRRAAVRLNRG